MAINELVTELVEPEPDSIWSWICDICGEPIFPDDELHNYHEPDCHNYQKFGESDGNCECSGMAHADCCPECDNMKRKPRHIVLTAEQAAEMDAFVAKMWETMEIEKEFPPAPPLPPAA